MRGNKNDKMLIISSELPLKDKPINTTNYPRDKQWQFSKTTITVSINILEFILLTEKQPPAIHSFENIKDLNKIGRVRKLGNKTYFLSE